MPRRSLQGLAMRHWTSLLAALAIAALAVPALDAVSDIHTRRSNLEQSARQSCPNRHDHACQGSVADIRAAAAAYDMVDLSIFQMITGVAGLILLGWTLMATRNAVQQSTEATRQMIRTNDMAERVQRAFLVAKIHPESGFGPHHSDPTKVHIKMRLSVSNHGKEPALDTQVFHHFHVAPKGHDPRDVWDDFCAGTIGTKSHNIGVLIPEADGWPGVLWHEVALDDVAAAARTSDGQCYGWSYLRVDYSVGSGETRRYCVRHYMGRKDGEHIPPFDHNIVFGDYYSVWFMLSESGAIHAT